MSSMTLKQLLDRPEERAPSLCGGLAAFALAADLMFDDDLTSFEFKMTTKTVPLKTSFVHTGSDLARLVLLGIYIVWILAYLFSE